MARRPDTLASSARLPYVDAVVSFAGKRRLAAVLWMDAAGYSRLIERDEEATLEQLNIIRREIIEPRVAQHDGSIVKTAGDGFLIEFKSPVEAVRCAVEMQRAVAAKTDACDEEGIKFRIGIHLGDVIAENDDLLGEGVNIAARLEALADPGSICISGPTYDQVREKVSVAFTDLGEQNVKNMARPIRVWRASPISPAALVERALKGAEKPSIAILPFTNMSGDSEQEYFADGITEDITTALSKWRWLLVIARNSTFVYKGHSVNVKQIARELGVRYVVEGSVRKAGNRVRITAQLIEAHSANHIWADKFDRDLVDIFALQDEITERIVTAIDPALRALETQRAIREPAIKAWDHYLRGAYEAAKYTKQANLRARGHFQEAIALDENFALAHAHLANTYHFEAIMNWTDRPDLATSAGYEIAERAVALDEREPMAHLTLAVIATQRRYFEKSIASAQRAVELNPNLARAQGALGRAFLFACRFDEAIRQFEIFLRLSPHDPMRWVIFGGLAMAHYMLGNYEQAADFARKSISLAREPYLRAHIVLVASLVRLHRLEDAKDACSILRSIAPGDLVAHIEAYRDQEYIDRLAQDLRAACASE